MLSGRVEVRNILSQKQPRQRFATRSIGVVSGNGSDDLSSLSYMMVDNGASANAIDSNAVDEICPTCRFVGADAAREKAQLIRLYRWEPKPADLGADGNWLVRREQRKDICGEWELVFLKHDHRRVGCVIDSYCAVGCV